MNSRYQEWLRHVFDHEVTEHQWYFSDGAPEFDAPPVEMTDLLSLTFLNAGKDLVKYNDAQVDQGIWYFVSTSGSSFLQVLKSSEVPLTKRLEAVENILYLYSDCYAKRCSETLGHLSEEGTPLNSSCYMFWDMSPLTFFKDSPDYQRMQDAVLKVLEKILGINHRACQESALHGLSEFAFSSREKMQKIVNDFLSKTKLDDKLLAYARNAKEGNVL